MISSTAPNINPAFAGARIPKSRPPSHAVSNPVDHEDGKPLKVLLVDDNTDLLDIAADLFRTFNFEVMTAQSGESALEILQRTPDLDVLFSDVVMPGMSGVELGHEARKLIPKIRIILVSGYPNQAIKSGQGNFHDFDFLNKPYRFNDIMELLQKSN